MRIHTLAKELGLKSRDLMDLLADRGIQVKNHMSSVDDDMAAQLRITAMPDEEPEVADEPEVEVKAEAAVEPEVEVKAEAPVEPEPEPEPEAEPTEVSVEEETPDPPAAEAEEEPVEEVEDPSASPAVGLTTEDRDKISPPRKKPTTIVMAPGFGNNPKVPVEPVRPVARPLPSGTKSPQRKVSRPLIIRSKAPARPPARKPVAPAARRAKPTERRPATPQHSSSPQGGKKVMVFPGTDTPGTGGPPRRSGPPGRGGPGGKSRGGRPGSRPRRQESDFTRRRLQQDIIPEDLPEKISLEEPASIKDLSLALGIKQTALLKRLMNHGKLANVNSPLTEEITDILSVEINCEIILEEPKALHSSLDDLDKFEDAEKDLSLRAPVVTLMGHVDHGKTTILDKIRESSITKSESGGITQHMSAYRVDKGDAHVVFVDTPGHRAFTSMRSRGANVTDVVVLVVAADDGPMPQTEEAIEHARAAEVPIVVAINKIDRPGANPDKVKARLSELDLAPVEWGGKTEMLPVSGITGEGIDELLEQLSLESEILELKANPQKNAIGTVLDSRASTGEGNVITALIQDGTLHPGDSVVCGPAFGKIRTLRSTSGENLTSAPPSTPVEITGLNDLPEAGDRLYGLDDLAKARQIAEERQEAKAKADRAERQKVTLEGLFDTIDQAKTQEINVVLKTDVKGTLDVLKGELSSLRTNEVAVRVIRAGVGQISESDILLADASSAIVIGFHVSASDRARSEAEANGVEIRTYSVIYEILDEMRSALEGMLAPDVAEEVQGSVEILQLFKSSKLGNIAGCIGRTGVVTRNDKVRLVRDGIVIHEGKLSSLKRVKDDVKEVRESFECGVVIQDYNDIKPGDIIESIKIIETSRSFDEAEASSD
ncbi:MAG: translation initiation factor IF-2 [Planctomycetota bacterium]|nr:translation initiation factor IF-2 [Planctomycetota bacterium]